MREGVFRGLRPGCLRRTRRDPATELPALARGSSPWADALAHWLIRRAARGAPLSLSERLEEEWLADLGERRGPMSRLRLALGCCWATRVIAHEHAATSVLAAGSAAGHKLMAASTQHEPSYFSRRTTAFLLIVCLHALIVCGLALGLGHTLSQVIPPVTPATLLPGAPETVELPPPIRPGVQLTRIDGPVPPLVDGPPDPGPMDDVITPRPEPPTPPPARPVNRLLGGPGKGFPNTNDYYPPAAIRLGETGVAAVRVCVDAGGRLTAEPVIAQTSGSALLDEGALRLAKAGSGRYRATIEDGRPVSSCYPFRIRFALGG